MRTKLSTICTVLTTLLLGSQFLPAQATQWAFSTGGDVHGIPCVAGDGTIYFGIQSANTRYLYALTANGALKWKRASDDIVAAIALDSTRNTLLVQTADPFDSNSGTLIAVATDGSVKWRHTTGATAGRYSPAVDNAGTVYARAALGGLYAINPDGTQKWHWQPATDYVCDSSPSVSADGTVYCAEYSFAFSKTRICAITQLGSTKWRVDVPAETGDLAIDADGGCVFGATYTGKVIKISASGTITWQTQVGGIVDSVPVIRDDGSIFVACFDRLHALTPDGALKWTHRNQEVVYGSARNGAAIASDGTVYYGSAGGYSFGTMYALNCANGEELWSYNAGAEIACPPTITPTGNLLFAASGGIRKLFAIAVGAPLATGPWPVARASLDNQAVCSKSAQCSYALSVSNVLFTALSGPGSFSVIAANGCTWSATVQQAWLHTSSSGTGNGIVNYNVDPNPTPSFRTGTITVSGKTFTMTQGPAGFVWHNTFGWSFNAGDGWYHHDGFGWMWFSADHWIWSSSLKGWIAATDANNSRTLWSTQFRWLTPSASDPYTATTTSIGAVYIGKYNGAAIPDSWVVSERFGYVWANGDGMWFYSDRYGWLGVTPEGGIWCVNLGRFL